MAQKFGSFQGTNNVMYLNHNGSVSTGDIWFDHGNSAIKIYNGTSWDEVGSGSVGIDDNATSTAITIDASENVGIGTATTTAIRLTSVTPTANHIAAQFENSNTADSFGLVVKGGNDANDYAADFRKRDNTNIMRIRGDGNVGIGTTSPSQLLNVAGNADVNGDFYVGSSNNIIYESGTTFNIRAAVADLTFQTNGANERMRIDSSGNVGIGTTSPSRLLTLSDSGACLLSLVSTDDDNCQVLFGDSASDTVGKVVYAHSTNHMRFETNSAERMRIDSSGNVGIGTTSPNTKLDVIGSSTNGSGVVDTLRLRNTGTSVGDGARIQFTAGTSTSGAAIASTGVSLNSADLRFYSGGNTERMRLEADGDLHVDGDVIAYSTTISDQRLKDNVETIEDALNKVTDLRGVTYTWNAGSRTGKSDMGVIAQEVESIIPEIVHDKKMALVDGETYKTVDYEKLTALLIEAVKELKAEVDALKASK